jgi:hypothetical protein
VVGVSDSTALSASEVPIATFIAARAIQHRPPTTAAEASERSVCGDTAVLPSGVTSTALFTRSFAALAQALEGQDTVGDGVFGSLRSAAAHAR